MNIVDIVHVVCDFLFIFIPSSSFVIKQYSTSKPEQHQNNSNNKETTTTKQPEQPKQPQQDNQPENQQPPKE